MESYRHIDITSRSQAEKDFSAKAEVDEIYDVIESISHVSHGASR